MANQMLTFLDNYDRRIEFLRTEGDQLLESIKSLEIGMNRRKQQGQQPYMHEVDWMYRLVKKFFGMLAEIKTCEYFKIIKELVSFNDDFYKKTCYAFFCDYIRKFNRTLNARRLNASGKIDFSVRL